MIKIKQKWSGIKYDEYNKDKKVLYELKNGKGAIKEFCDNNNIIVYEGEYLNGEKNGKGKEYDFFTNLEFEGEYLNDQKNGKGKE